MSDAKQEVKQEAKSEKPVPKREVEIVTSETLSDFVGKKLGIEPKAEAKSEAEQKSEPEAEAKPEAKAEKEPEKKNPVQPRINELVAERNAERARAERAERELAELRANRQQATPEKKAEHEAKDDPKPKPEQFKDAFEYAEALSEWTSDRRVKEALAERDKKAEELSVQQQQQENVRAWHGRQAEIRKEIEDYDDVVGSSQIRIRNDLQQAVIESERGPWLVYHFAQHPEALEKLNAMPPVKALRELGKLEASLEKTAEKKSEPAKDAKTEPAKPAPEKSKAPEPIQPLNATGGAAETPREKLDFQTWKAQRKAGRIH